MAANSTAPIRVTGHIAATPTANPVAAAQADSTPELFRSHSTSSCSLRTFCKFFFSSLTMKVTLSLRCWLNSDRSAKCSLTSDSKASSCSCGTVSAPSQAATIPSIACRQFLQDWKIRNSWCKGVSQVAYNPDPTNAEPLVTRVWSSLKTKRSRKYFKAFQAGCPPVLAHQHLHPAHELWSDVLAIFQFLHSGLPVVCQELRHLRSFHMQRHLTTRQHITFLRHALRQHVCTAACGFFWAFHSLLESWRSMTRYGFRASGCNIWSPNVFALQEIEIIMKAPRASN